MYSTRSRAPKAPATEPGWARSALVLCAHGVDGGAGSAAAHARRLAGRGLFGEVRACCLHGAPSLAETIAAVSPERVYVVPFLMGEGHTARVVLRRELAGLRASGKIVTLCRPVGTGAGMETIVARRAAAACRAAGWPPEEAVLAVAGHGTPRHKESGRTALALADRFRRGGGFKDAAAGFLEQEPRLADLVARHRGERIVAVGLFADDGPHGRDDMRRLLAPAGDDAIYLGAIGTVPEMTALILDRVRDGHKAGAVIQGRP
jgi:sirohydrochlorin ferrochelatase